MTTGVLPFTELKRLIVLNTGFFETSAYTENDQMKVTAGNFDGAGMSAGCLQYNFGTANRLTELFQHMLNNYDAVVQTAFGANTAEYTDFRTHLMNDTRTQLVTWADTVLTDRTRNAEGRKLSLKWEGIFANLLVTAECKAKYYQMSDAYYFPEPYDLFRQMSCKSRAALASMYDIMVNKGRYYPINLIQVDFENIDANNALTEAEKEAQKIYQINFRGNEEENSLNDTSSSGFLPRRSCMWNQGGTYYGATYDPETQFDINQEPAITEKAANNINLKLGTIDVNDVYIGTNKIDSIYLGANLLGGAAEGYTTSEVPITQFRTNPNSYAGIGAVTSVDLDANQPLWVDVRNFVACKTYYTIDGSTPTINSTLYTEALTFSSSCTLKTITISIFGIAEAVATLTVNVAAGVEIPITYISPSEVIQNQLPITVNLTRSILEATTYYKIGTGTQQTFAAPFVVGQSTVGVQSTQIPITYWSVSDLGGTEAQRTLTYDTSGAMPAKPVATATAGDAQVALDWNATANTTSYTVYRSTAAGTIGTILLPSQYQTATNYTDTTAINDTTYYYTVRAANYGQVMDSDQVIATPSAVPIDEPSIHWINGQNVSIAQDGTITKTGGGDAWNAGADSSEQFDGSTDAIIEYIPATTDVRIAIGFDEVADGIELYRNKDVDWNWEINPAGLNEITVNEIKKYAGTYAAGDVFRVALESGVIRFYQNGNVMFENTDAIAFPIVADCAIYLQGQSLKAELIIPAKPAKPVATTIAGNWYVRVNWTATADTDSYNVYRSTAAGVLGEILSTAQIAVGFDDNTPINDTTYYYTVRANNVNGYTDSDQSIATPAAPAPSGYRYLKIEGYGASEAGQETTTRMIELEAFVGVTNVLAGRTAISFSAISSGSTNIATLTDGVKTTTSNTYPIWWTATPNANVVFDLGSSQALTKLAYYGYSTAGVPRANRFKWYGSNTNNGVDWVTLWDASANVTMQPAIPNGYQQVL